MTPQAPAVTPQPEAPLPTYTPPPVDPAVTAAQAQAQTASVNALMSQAQMDSASILARYGTQLSMAGAAFGSPLAAK